MVYIGERELRYIENIKNNVHLLQKNGGILSGAAARTGSLRK